MIGRNTAARLDAATRRAASALTRREALLALGGAALAASTASPLAANGGNGGKAGKKAKKACKRQGEQCRQLVIATCRGDQDCVEDQLRCCNFFAKCEAGPGFACFTD